MNRQELIKAGVDYDEGVERFASKPQMYEKYLAKFFAGSFMDELKTQLGSGDIESAFRTAHNIKGASGNLSLNRFYEKICELTELLRKGSTENDCSELFAQAAELYESAKSAAEKE